MTQENKKSLPAIGFVEATKRGLKNMFNFSGRARRSEFWWFFAPWSVIITLLLAQACLQIVEHFFIPITDGMSEADYVMMMAQNASYQFLGLFVLIGVVMGLFLASIVRRLHDVNIGGWPLYAVFGCYCVLLVIDCIAYSYSPEAVYPLYSEDGLPVNATWYVIVALLLLVLPILYAISLLICLFDGRKESNKYGDSPKYK